MKHVIFLKISPGKWIHKLSACLKKMLNFTKPVSCLVIGTAQQIDTKLVHPFEKFRQNLLVKFFFVRGFKFLTHELKQRKLQSGFVEVQNI